MPYLSFSETLLQEAYIIFPQIWQFWDSVQTCEISVWGALPPLRIPRYMQIIVLISNLAY